MMLRITTPLCLVALAGMASAQSIDITSTYRAYSLFASGYDYEFDEYLYVLRDTNDLTAPWNQSETMVLDDYYGVEVSRAFAEHTSELSDRGMSASMTSVGSSDPAPYFRTDAGGNNVFESQFEVARRVRYRMSLDIQTSLEGYSVVTGYMVGPQGPFFSLQVFGGDDEGRFESGWLQVGSYNVDLELDAGILLTHGESEACTTTTDFELEIFDAADFDMDEDVDRDDRQAFRQAFAAGSPNADVDGDGDTDGRDRRLFMRAWMNSFFQVIWPI